MALGKYRAPLDHDQWVFDKFPDSDVKAALGRQGPVLKHASLALDRFFVG